MPEAIVIGAGPAGSLAACALARRGWDVTLVEQHRFPRDKVCGESLSALGIEVLGRMGLADRIAGLSPTILSRTALHATDGRSVSLPLARPMWGLSRAVMDLELLRAAEEAGVRVVQGVRCESIERGGVSVRYLLDNRVATFATRWTIVADGKGALLPARPVATRDFGIKAHYTGVSGPRDAVELFGVRGHYVGLAPIEGGLWNVAFSVPAARLEQFRGDLDGLWAQLLSENDALADRFANATRAGGWLASPLPRFGVARRWPAGVIPLGNSAAALEPIGGEGMGLAMRSAELAAEALDECERNGRPLPVAKLRRAFDRLWKVRRVSCRALARVLSHPGVAGHVIDWARGSESLSRAGMALIGKS